MAASLEVIRGRLLSRLRIVDSAFDRHILSPAHFRKIDKFALQEGLVSNLWQSWCAFCRETLLSSALGTVSLTGARVTSPFSAHSESEIIHAASIWSKNQKLSRIKPHKGVEPTWGDVDKINLIANGMASTNLGQLLTAFGAALAIKDLQLCRNASAHININTITNINAARVRYNNTSYNHPSDVIAWIDPSTKDYLWKTWIEEMVLISDFAIQ